MSANTSEPDHSELAVNPTVIDFILLDERLAPGETLAATWRDAIRDEDIVPLIHGALVYIHEHYPGHSIEATSSADAFRDGVAFAIVGLLQSIESIKADKGLLGSNP